MIYVFLISLFLKTSLGSEEETSKKDFVFLKILNDVRRNPLEYEKYIGNEFSTFFEKNLRKNRNAFNDLQNMLLSFKDRKELTMNMGLQKAAIDHSNYMYFQSKLSHLEKNSVTPKERLKDLGIVKDLSFVYQIVAKFSIELGNMLNIVLFLLLENEKLNRNNKRLLLSENIRDIGIGIIFKKGFFYVTILIAEDFECTLKECIEQEEAQ